jgi:rhodanese-related sulfurtransferase
MAIAQRSPTEAHKALQNDPSAIYLDVRTEGEFERGHAPDSYNVPIIFLNPGQSPAMNPDFVTIVERICEKDLTLVIGCKTGGRSQHACEILEQIGYTNLTNVQGGFIGIRDEAGSVVTRGWVDCDLPVETEISPGKGYPDLAPKI